VESQPAEQRPSAIASVEIIARQQREIDELKACKMGANFRRSRAAPSEEANDAAFHRK